MLDTIEVRIHDVVRPYGHDYQSHLRMLLERSVLQKDSRGGKKTMKKVMVGDVVKHEITKTTIAYWDTGREVEIAEWGGNEVGSWDHQVQYRFDNINNWLDLKWSIPKHFYDHNVFQFVPHMNVGQAMSLAQAKDWDWNVDVVKDRMIASIYAMFDDLFGACNEIDPRDVEVRRLDLCYNQIFKSKEEALDYYHSQRSISKKFSRPSTTKGPDFDGIHYKGNGCSYKIYHKGTEFRVHDKPRLIKKNRERFKAWKERGREGRCPQTPVEQIEAWADCILRYEIMYRCERISWFWKRMKKTVHRDHMGKIAKVEVVPAHFRKNDQAWIDRVLNFRKLDSMKKNHSKSKEVNANRLTAWDKATSNMRKEHEQMDAFLSRTCDFRLSIDGVMCGGVRSAGRFIRPSVRDYNNMNWPLDFPEKRAPFTKALLVDLFDDFRKFIEEFQLGKVSDKWEIIRGMKERNDRNKAWNQAEEDMGFSGKRKVKYTSGFAMFLTLREKHSMKEIKEIFVKTGVIAKATFYRYRTQLEKMGIGDKDVLERDIPVRVDFLDYHNFLSWQFPNKDSLSVLNLSMILRKNSRYSKKLVV